jgi:hypothetical protein
VEWSELLLVLPKEEAGHYWKTLFEGGEEKSYWEVGWWWLMCCTTPHAGLTVYCLCCSS